MCIKLHSRTTVAVLEVIMVATCGWPGLIGVVMARRLKHRKLAVVKTDPAGASK